MMTATKTDEGFFHTEKKPKGRQSPDLGTRNKGGRPSRAEASARALALVQRLGIDGEAFDPKIVLQAIASDTSLPASARVSACKILLELQSEARKDEVDPISARAITLLADNGRAH